MPNNDSADRLRSTFAIPGMDCPSEERLIRMALADNNTVAGIAVDLEARTATIEHDGDVQAITQALIALKLGAELRDSKAVEAGDAPTAPADPAGEARVLRQLLAINAVMFVLELGVGWWAQSTGLLADSLDMLADAWVYGLSLYAVGRAASMQYRAARLSGFAQLLLGLLAVAEVVRRFLVGSEPHSTLMMAMATVALLANVSCVVLLHRHREGGVHMKASWIFSTNDAIANVGVILAGALVYATGSALPDLVVGILIALVVLRGAVRILRLPGPGPASS